MGFKILNSFCMSKKFFVFGLLLVSVMTVTKAQFSTVGQPTVDLKNIVPKSPQADQLNRVNEITVNSARGVPQINFNLYTASAGGLQIPISISYDASGIRYDDISSSIGLKWSLQAGGEISRNINGREDEFFYFANAYKYSQDIISAWNMYTDSAQSFLGFVNNNQKDVSQDEYSYNYLDRSGSFFFRKNKFWDSEKPYINKIETDNLSTFHNIWMTDELGNKAYFGYDNEEASSVIYSGNGYVSPVVPTDGASAWKLTKLKAYTNQEALFEYDTVSYTVTKLLSEAYVKRTSPNPDPALYNCNCGESDINANEMQATYLVYLPKKITTPNEEVNFYYSIDNSLTVYKKRLDSIVVKDRVYQKRVKKFRFVYGKYSSVDYLRLDKVWNMGIGGDSVLVAGFHYTDGIVGISSKARDIFNYNNGASNSYLISTTDTDCPSTYRNGDRTIDAFNITNGTMDSIFYPTGGKAAFFYSPNVINDTCGPGIRVDSIKYYNSDNSLASSLSYTYAEMQGGYYFDEVVNNIDLNDDNASCVVKTFNSEYSFNTLTGTSFYYKSVETRKRGAESSEDLLTKEYFTSGLNCYFKPLPMPEKKIYFRDNNLSDTVRKEVFDYTTLSVDTATIDWLYPAYSILPGQFYYLDGIEYENTSTCTVIYSGVGRHAILKPQHKFLSSTVSKDFDQVSSARTLESVANRAYNSYWQPLTDKSTNSKGLLDSVVYNYLHTNGNSLSSTAITANLYGLVDKTTKYTNTVQQEKSRIGYVIQSNGFIQPDSFLIQRGSFAESFDKRITIYDTSGHITELETGRNFYTSLLRDYNNQLIVAQVTNAKQMDIAYTSFEAEGKGGWTFSGSTTVHPTAATGNKGYSLAGGNITKSGLTSGTTYIVSYWKKDSASSVTVNSGSGTDVVTLHGWKLISHEITGTTSLTISGTAYVDELRVHPKNAQMVTYAYNPLVGVTHQCDANNRITYYEYDLFNRLKLGRDQDKKIIKRNDYKYQATNQQ